MGAGDKSSRKEEEEEVKEEREEREENRGKINAKYLQSNTVTYCIYPLELYSLQGKIGDTTKVGEEKDLNFNEKSKLAYSSSSSSLMVPSFALQDLLDRINLFVDKSLFKVNRHEYLWHQEPFQLWIHENISEKSFLSSKANFQEKGRGSKVETDGSFKFFNDQAIEQESIRISIDMNKGNEGKERNKRKEVTQGNEENKGNELREVYIKGSTTFGDNIEDEWLIVYILREISRVFASEVAIKIFDNDGQFLLIEAADLLPDWVEPETAVNRFWLYRGEFHLIDQNIAKLYLTGRRKNLSLVQALQILHDSTFNSSFIITDRKDVPANSPLPPRTRATAQIQDRLNNRMLQIDDIPRKTLHRTVALLPFFASQLIKSKPSIIPHAVQALKNCDSRMMNKIRGQRSFLGSKVNIAANQGTSNSSQKDDHTVQKNMLNMDDNNNNNESNKNKKHHSNNNNNINDNNSLSSWKLVTVTFTRCSYAMFNHESIPFDISLKELQERLLEEKYPSRILNKRNSKNNRVMMAEPKIDIRKAFDIGIKLLYALELMYLESKTKEEMGKAFKTAKSEEELFRKKLTKSDFFEGESKGSRKYQKKVQEAINCIYHKERAMKSNTPLLHEEMHQIIEEIENQKEREKEKEVDPTKRNRIKEEKEKKTVDDEEMETLVIDDESWLEISPEEVDNLLQTYSGAFQLNDLVTDQGVDSGTDDKDERKNNDTNISYSNTSKRSSIDFMSNQMKGELEFEKLTTGLQTIEKREEKPGKSQFDSSGVSFDGFEGITKPGLSFNLKYFLDIMEKGIDGVNNNNKREATKVKGERGERGVGTENIERKVVKNHKGHFDVGREQKRDNGDKPSKQEGTAHTETDCDVESDEDTDDDLSFDDDSFDDDSFDEDQEIQNVLNRLSLQMKQNNGSRVDIGQENQKKNEKTLHQSKEKTINVNNNEKLNNEDFTKQSFQSAEAEVDNFYELYHSVLEDEFMEKMQNTEDKKLLETSPFSVGEGIADMIQSYEMQEGNPGPSGNFLASLGVGKEILRSSLSTSKPGSDGE